MAITITMGEEEVEEAFVEDTIITMGVDEVEIFRIIPDLVL